MIDWVRPLRDTWIFWFATALHSLWAVILLRAGDEVLATPLASLLQPGPDVAAACLAMATILAIWGLVGDGPWWSFVPQHALLMLSAMDSGWAILQGEYADGIARPVAFIAADQLPTILIASCYTLAVVEHVLWRHRDQFRTWPQWVVGAHLLVYASLLSVATVAYSAETRATEREFEQLASAADNPELLRYRLDQVEARVKEGNDQRTWIIGLLISNLVALVASMGTYIVMNRRRDRP
jgi:hypothetical protein